MWLSEPNLILTERVGDQNWKKVNLKDQKWHPFLEKLFLHKFKKCLYNPSSNLWTKIVFTEKGHYVWCNMFFLFFIQYQISVLQLAGFLLPCYVVGRSWYVVQCRRRRQVRWRYDSFSLHYDAIWPKVLRFVGCAFMNNTNEILISSIELLRKA